MAFLYFPDLDSITLDDLSLGSTVPVMGDPALIIREYLHPGQQYSGQNMQGRDHRLKVAASSINPHSLVLDLIVLLRFWSQERRW